MSSERATAVATETNTSTNTEPFRYVPTGNGGAGGLGEESPMWNAQNTILRSVAEQLEKDALLRGIHEGEMRARTAAEEQIAASRAALAASLEAFKAERASYFSRIEPEVVQLALSIARKILHREAQLDPLLLTGMVHVALEKLDRGSHIRLRANPEDIHFWSEYFANGTDSHAPPELVGDPQLKPGECSLETEVGNTLISLETHLKEIEQGFLDLLEQRPRVR
jgi:flagellar assembly protein FliH